MSISLSSHSEKKWRIGEVAKLTGLSADTLRYYEKLGLLVVARNSAGVRFYTQNNLSTLRFIQRGKSMDFSLEEVSRLLEMRTDPQHAKQDVRELTHQKLEVVKKQIQELEILRNELTLLVNLCGGTEGGCPIIEDMESDQYS